MLKFIFRKLLSNKGLNMALITGTIFWIAVFTMLPVFSNGSVNQVLTTGFSEYAKDNNEYPAVIDRSGTISTQKANNIADIMNSVNAKEDEWLDALGLNEVARQHLLRSEIGLGRTYYGGRNKRVEIAYVPDFDNVLEVVDNGEPAFDTGNDAYPIFISEYAMDTLSFVSGEEIYFDEVTDENGQKLHLRVAGIIREKEGSELFWYHRLADYKIAAFTDEESFNEIISRFGLEEIMLENCVSIDYRDIRFDNADDVTAAIEDIAKKDKNVSYNFKDILNDYKQQKSSIRGIMLAAALPLFALLITFILMVSSSITENERGEMAVLRSRGIKRREIIMLYFIRSFIIALIALVPGIALGSLFVWIGKQTNGFLIFQAKDASDYYLNPSSIMISVIGMLTAVMLITLPVIGLSKKTIIDNKNESMSSAKKPLWKKIYLDVILTLISLYLLHNYKEQSGLLSEKMVNGESIDPLIMLGSSVFIIGIGLLLLRLIDLLVRFIFFLGRKHWGAASFAGFLQIIKSSGRQGIISVFMVLTLAMGIFDASLARTVNENNAERIRYDVGSDVRMTGKWVRRMRFSKDAEPVYYYEEPDYADYRQLYDDGILSNITRVIYDESAEVETKNNKKLNANLMAINTTEFGRTASLKSGLNDSHWYNALNSIAESAEGIIISSNLADELKLKVGDKIKVTRYDIDVNKSATGTVNGTIMYIVDAWPGFEKYSYVKDEEGKLKLNENYLVVMNYAKADSSYRITTYDVWGRLADGVSAEDFEAEIEKRNLELTKYEILPQLISEMRDSAIIQITNGLFSIHFIISIIICILGFLIYWITNVRKRALQFGIYRAMGLRMKEIVKMLVMEHFFSSFLAIAAGAGAGVLSSMLYDKVIAIIYLPKKHNIPIDISVPLSDILKPVLIITAALFVAFIIISRIIKGMKISETLKMGEDS